MTWDDVFKIATLIAVATICLCLLLPSVFLHWHYYKWKFMPGVHDISIKRLP